MNRVQLICGNKDAIYSTAWTKIIESKVLIINIK